MSYSGTLSKYYSSKHWRDFRKSLTDPKDCKCDICSKPRYTKFKKKDGYKRKFKKFDIHHLTYETLGHEKREDVLILCSSCHTLFHSMEMMSRTRGKIFTKLYNIVLKETKWGYKKRDV